MGLAETTHRPVGHLVGKLYGRFKRHKGRSSAVYDVPSLVDTLNRPTTITWCTKTTNRHVKWTPPIGRLVGIIVMNDRDHWGGHISSMTPI